MAGRGPAPKVPDQRARRNKPATPLRMITVVPDAQPSLKEAIGSRNPMTGKAWHAATLRLWESLGSFPTTRGLLMAQWLMLARAMMLDDAVMEGDARFASEARLQIAKFGITPDDVARLRFVLAQAEGAEDANAERSERRTVSARERYGQPKRLEA